MPEDVATVVEHRHFCAKEGEIAAIYERVKAVPTAREFAAVATSLTGVVSELHDLNKCIRGNGTPGLRTEVTLNTQFRKQVAWLAALVIVQIAANLGQLAYKMFIGPKPRPDYSITSN